MKKVYIIIEWNGESYDDYDENPVKAFISESKAQKYCENMNATFPIERFYEKFYIQEVDLED